MLLNLAKKTDSGDNLNNICDNSGSKFVNDSDRNRHIGDFYRSLYQPDPNVQGTIEDFLGPEICAHPMVLGSKLNMLEKNHLDRPLDVAELDKALLEANLRSAPGVDGYSYRFIAKFWRFFRIPLFKCAEQGLEDGSLPDFFKTAVIKLIPKKGDTTMIKNWRPISLLINFYKIISRLINSRLQDFTDRLLSRAQKGFTKSRQIHEVIINCMETMGLCKKNNIKGVIVSIDQTKAFDSVSHSYMEQVYDFFSFGDRIKKWLRSIGTGRSACIGLGGDTYSETFPLGKGHAQGDSPSPLLYNLAAQIVIFKIELNPSIVRIPRPLDFEEVAVPVPTKYKGEGLGQTDINESFADDSSNIFVFEMQSLAVLKKILERFKILSGLSSNLEKSFIMRIGNQHDDIPDEIAALGFSFTNKLKLLGFTLQNYGDITASNYEQVNIKIDNLIRFWERFFLSLPGRILIYKTLLIPQINYIATIFTPPSHTIRSLQAKMEKFVLGGLSMSKDRIYRSVAAGGLGLFDLRDFVAALQCSWFKRCSLSINDNWRYRLALYGNGNPLHVINDRKTKEGNGLVLNNIIDSYSYFKSKFTPIDNNFMVTPFFCNDAFGYGRGFANKLDDIFFDCHGNNALRTSLLTLTWKDLVSNGVFFSREEILIRLNIALPLEKYNILKQVYQIALRKYFKVGKVETSLSEFFRSFKKGSKKFRIIMSGTVSEQTVKSGTQVRTFLRTIEEDCPSFARLRSLYSNWNVSFLNSSIREFIFKYYNNILGTNSRVATLFASS